MNCHQDFLVQDHPNSNILYANISNTNNIVLFVTLVLRQNYLRIKKNPDDMITRTVIKKFNIELASLAH